MCVSIIQTVWCRLLLINLINDYYSDSDSDICVRFLDSSVNLCIPTVVLFSIKCQAYFTVL